MHTADGYLPRMRPNNLATAGYGKSPRMAGQFELKQSEASQKMNPLILQDNSGLGLSDLQPESQQTKRTPMSLTQRNWQSRRNGPNSGTTMNEDSLY